MRHLVVLQFLALIVAGCGSPPETLTGRWEFLDATNLLGQPGNPSTMQIKLMITNIREDSVFGKAYFAFDPTPHEQNCAVVKGVRTGRAKLNLVVFTVDEPAMDMFFEGRFEGDSLLMTSVRPRSGKSVLPWGSWLVFQRTSNDTVSGCLTSA
jgi:hypothetical protein